MASSKHICFDHSYFLWVIMFVFAFQSVFFCFFQSDFKLNESLKKTSSSSHRSHVAVQMIISFLLAK